MPELPSTKQSAKRDNIAPETGAPRFWRWLLPALCILGFAAWLANGIEMAGLSSAPWHGYWDAVVASTGQPFVAEFVDPTAGGATERAGIRNGDRVDLRALSAYGRVALLFQPVPARPVVLTVRRRGKTFVARVVGTTLYNVHARLKVPLAVLASVARLWLLGCALLIALRRWRLREGRLLCFGLLAFAGALMVAPAMFAVPNGAFGVAVYFASGCLLCTAAVLPVLLGRTLGVRSRLRTTIEALAYATGIVTLVGFAATAIGLLDAAIDPLPFIYGTWRALPAVMLLAAIAAVALATASAGQAERARTAWLLLPLPTALFLYTGITDSTISAPSWNAYMAFYTLAYAIVLAGAAAVTYALLKRRVLDLELVVSRTLVAAGVSTVIVVSFVLLEWLLGTVLAHASHAAGLAANAALALVLGLSMSFIHKRVDSFVDFLFFHKRHEDERALRDFAKEAAFVTVGDDLLDRSLETVRLHTDASAAAILLDGDGTYRAARWFGEAPAEVSENDALILALKAKHAPLDPHRYQSAIVGDIAFPMSARGRLLGVLLCGRRAGGVAYVPDEIEALSELANGAGVALDALDRTERGMQRDDAILAELRSLREAVERSAAGPRGVV